MTFPDDRLKEPTCNFEMPAGLRFAMPLGHVQRGARLAPFESVSKVQLDLTICTFSGPGFYRFAPVRT